MILYGFMVRYGENNRWGPGRPPPVVFRQYERPWLLGLKASALGFMRTQNKKHFVVKKSFMKSFIVKRQVYVSPGSNLLFLTNLLNRHSIVKILSIIYLTLIATAFHFA